MRQQAQFYLPLAGIWMEGGMGGVREGRECNAPVIGASGQPCTPPWVMQLPLAQHYLVHAERGKH